MNNDNDSIVIQLDTFNESPPAYTAGYAEAPLDVSEEQYHDFVGIPDHEIVAIDKKYVSNKHIIYCIKEDLKSFDPATNMMQCDTLKITDDDGYEQYNCKIEGNKAFIYNKDGTPIVNSFDFNSNYQNMCIYRGEGITDQIATIKTKNKVTDDIQIYRVQFFNITSNKNEELVMRYNKLNHYHYIYCNKDKENENIIGTIKVNKKLKKEYKVEISPMVDTILLLSLGTLVVRLFTIKKMYNRRKNVILSIVLICLILFLYFIISRVKV